MEDAAADQNACHREKLQRLHSLLFGAEISLSNGEIETSLGLALRLLGFLLGECQTAEDEVRLRPLIRQTYQRIDAAQQATLVDRSVVLASKDFITFSVGLCCADLLHSLHYVAKLWNWLDAMRDSLSAGPNPSISSKFKAPSTTGLL